MKFSVCINAIGFSAYGLEPLAGGKTCLAWVATALARLEGMASCHLLHGPAEKALVTGLLEEINWEFRAAGKAELAVQALALDDESAAAGFRALAGALPADLPILVASALAPALHAGLSARLLDNHVRYHAEYSFADGYPLGMSPQLIQPEALGLMADLAEKRQTSLREIDGIFETIRQDINAFEIETEIAPIDLRLLRINLHCDTRQNTELCRRLLPLCQLYPFEDEPLLARLRDDQSALRTLPSFFNVQIHESCPQACPVCPWTIGRAVQAPGRSMAASDFAALASRIRDFAPESVISLSMWGEPALHPQIWQIIEAVGALPPLKLYVETSGLGWDAAALEAFAASGRHGHVTWIVSLDANDEAAYRAMRGEGWQEALAAAHLFTRLFPESAYVQAVRTSHNDPSLQAHFQYWQKQGAKQIIQKYDHWSGKLPDLRLSDIAPLKRQACWHLKRDMAILVDGTVPLCRQDLPPPAQDAHQLVAGNALSGDLAKIWAAAEPQYLAQLRGDYLGLCRNCDEYYTFNH